MTDKIEKPARLEHAREHDLQFGETSSGIFTSADGAPRLEPLLPAPGAPMRACTPSEAISVAL